MYHTYYTFVERISTYFNELNFIIAMNVGNNYYYME